MQKKLFFVVFSIVLLFNNCYIEETYTFKERISSRWIFGGRTAFMKDSSSIRNFLLDPCEVQLEFTFFEDGTLVYNDYKEKEYHDGTDICEENLLTKEEGVWSILPSDNLKITLQNNEDHSEILIEPFEIYLSNEDEWLNIRYTQYENTDENEISYFVYHYRRVYL